MKKTLTKILFISLLFSAIMPTRAQANNFLKGCVAGGIGTTITLATLKVWDNRKAHNKKEAVDNNLKQAIGNNDTAKVNQILKENPIIKETGKFLDGNYFTPIIFADRYGHPEIVKLLLKDMPVLLLKDMHVYDKTALLLIALKHDNTEMVKLLLEYDADANVRDKNGLAAALMIAVEKDNTEMVKLLFEHGARFHGARFNVQKNNSWAFSRREDKNDRTTLIMIAVKNDNTEIAELLLEYGADANVRDKNDQTTLIMIATENDNTEIAKLLLEYGADANARDKNGRTVLMIAAERSTYAKKAENIVLKNEFDNLIRLLLVSGANPLIKDKGKTVLDQNDNEVIRKFMDQQILPILNDKKFTPLTENPA